MDVKIGQQTYDPNAPQKKREREISKYEHQHEIGFRICGMKVYDHATGEYRFVDKLFGRTLTPDTLQSGFLDYLDCHHPNSSFVARVAAQFVDRLRNIAAYFDVQNKNRFFSSSLLFVYDADPAHLNISSVEPLSGKSSLKTDIFMIDFGHIFPIQDVGSAPEVGSTEDMRDEGYLHGTKRLIREFELLSLPGQS